MPGPVPPPIRAPVHPAQRPAPSPTARAAQLAAAAALAETTGGGEGHAKRTAPAPDRGRDEGAARLAAAGTAPQAVTPNGGAAPAPPRPLDAFVELFAGFRAEAAGRTAPAASSAPQPATDAATEAARGLAAPIEAPQMRLARGRQASAAKRARPEAAAPGPRPTAAARRGRPLLRRAAWLGAAIAFALWAFLVGPAGAQEITVDLGGGSLTARIAQLFVLITLLSLAPGLAIMVTCFPFMVTVLSILRQALGVQQAPPNMMIVSLALFLTYFVIEPVFQQSWEQGVEPLIEGRIEESEGVSRAFEPFRAFMEGRVDGDTLAVMVEASPSRDTLEAGERPPIPVLIPAFLLSEIQRGFEVGFLIFLPFLIIDLVIASVLMSMGMMMVPPAVVALPFKLAFFVVADGWTLLAGALVRGYS